MSPEAMGAVGVSGVSWLMAQGWLRREQMSCFPGLGPQAAGTMAIANRKDDRHPHRDIIAPEIVRKECEEGPGEAKQDMAAPGALQPPSPMGPRHPHS